MSGDLELVTTDHAVEVVDRALDTWAVRIQSIDVSAHLPTTAATPAVLRALADQVPGFRAAMESAAARSRFFEVTFSPAVQRGLANGSYELVRTATGAAPVARSATTGQFVGQARVVQQAGVAARVGGGAGLATLAGAALPVAVAVGAAWAQQRWLEETLGRLQSALSRIEHRLRDDDHGAITAADSLVELLLPTIMEGEAPPQLRLELAAARQQVDAVFAARARFVDRFKRALETEQIEKANRKGRVVTWVPTAARAGDEDEGVLEELVVFVRAMMTRSRLATCTAAILAAEGFGRIALQLLQTTEDELRGEYYDLHNRVRALANHAPDSPFWRRLPMVPAADAERAHVAMRSLASEMDRCIGARLPDRETPVAIAVTAEDLAEAFDAEPMS